MKRYSYEKLFMAGFLATFVMTLIVHPLFRVQLPNVEFATMIGSLLAGKTAAPYTLWWWVGLAEHFVNGTFLFPLLYAHTLGRLPYDSPLVEGILWAVLVWLFSQTVVLPLAGLGLFGAEVHDSAVVAAMTLFIHVIYGLLFGAVLGFSPSKQPTSP